MCASQMHFRHLAEFHEAVLQINDNVRRVTRTQAVEYRDSATVAYNSFANLVPYFGVMHGGVPDCRDNRLHGTSGP
ncbi:hypothetical protein MesoLj131c_63460 [Mesorhizobium sp. 131-3-5]|nr:hypothetical protein MesoLj131c_63460 [Mesorhizobium sp. 131-3-5]